MIVGGSRVEIESFELGSQSDFLSCRGAYRMIKPRHRFTSVKRIVIADIQPEDCGNTYRCINSSEINDTQSTTSGFRLCVGE